ncbi:flavin monoamine oxidase family protein [Luteithermobacter gelatinilyticus]|uniref:flavin monoamine oxidase family protein n=1 Tax=Luteithermobacter gelatinilyticus TaxID=2582913 RepID=UPI001106CE88|nr:NAD(P)/FAD-dependent oxidoreductase [Luteithermobacter gelatinilyticus]
MKKSVQTPTRRRVLAGLGAVAGAASLSPGLAHTHTAAASHYDVLIIGAGISGLHAARILEREGAKLLILEASARTGGRLLTLKDVPGRPEAGGLQVGPMYARLRSTAVELGIDLEDFPPSPPGLMISYEGHSTTLQGWPDWSHNPLPEKLKKIPPFALLNAALPRPNPLAELDSWKEADAFQYDVPVSRYLDKMGDSAAIRKMAAVGLQGININDVSALGELRKNRVMMFEKNNGTSQKIKGGSSRLPEVMARSLKCEIRHHKKVIHVNREGARLWVKCSDGSQYSANHIICTAPFSVVRYISFDPPVPALQHQAITHIPYLPVTSFFFTAETPFWEQDGLPPGMWTTSILERIFPLPSPSGQVDIFWGLINGAQALTFDRLARAEQEKTILEELARLRPATQGKLTVHKIHSWTAQPHARGAWAYWKAGQIRKFSATFDKPHHNIHFAGEHTATFSAGMEGAFESAERAAWEILDT